MKPNLTTRPIELKASFKSKMSNYSKPQNAISFSTYVFWTMHYTFTSIGVMLYKHIPHVQKEIHMYLQLREIIQHKMFCSFIIGTALKKKEFARIISSMPSAHYGSKNIENIF